MFTSRRMSFSCSKSFRSVIPFRKAWVAASCMTTPSAIGSLKGIPISIMSIPFSSNVLTMLAVLSSVGLPAQKYNDSISCCLRLNNSLIRFIVVLFYLLVNNLNC